VRKRKKNIIRSIAYALVVAAILITAIFYLYKFFFGKEKVLEEDTFIFAILEKDQDNVEHINNLFLIDMSGEKDKKVQIISIPADLKCEVPGVSVDKIGDLYPFGGGSLVTSSISDKTGLNIGYYIIITENYFKILLDEISPLEVLLVEDMKIDESDFMAGEVELNSKQIRFILNYEASKDYYREVQENKLYVVKEVFANLRDKKVNLLNSQTFSGMETNTDGSQISQVISYFLDDPYAFYYDFLDESYIKEDSEDLKVIVLDNDYSNIELQGIKKYYEEPVEEEKVEVTQEEVVEQLPEESLAREDIKIQLLNGNYIPGSATATSLKLEELGYSNFDIGNVEDGAVYENSFIYFKSGLDDFAYEIGMHLGIDKSFIGNFEDEASSDFDILIIVGLDFREE